jgi:hypothetical protein
MNEKKKNLWPKRRFSRRLGPFHRRRPPFRPPPPRLFKESLEPKYNINNSS